MQQFINKFWEYNPKINEFEQFGRLHITILLIIAITIYLIYINRDSIRKLPQRPIEIGLGLMLVTPRLMMYFWYFNYETTLREVLPLYLCRIVIICTAYTLLTGRNELRFITYYWGVFGSVLALLFVDTGGYTFPHVMFFSFFVGHAIMFISAFYMVFISDYTPSIEDLRKIIICSVVYLFITNEVNQLVGGNYNYLESSPSALNLSKTFVKSMYYKLSILSCFILFSVIEYLPFKKKNRYKSKYN